MAKKKRDRRSFTEDFKQQLIAEIEGGKKLIDVAQEHGLQPSQLSLWRKKYGSGRPAKKTAKAARPDAPKAAAKRTRTSSASPATPEPTSEPAAAPTPAPSAPRNIAPASSSFSTGIAELERMIGQLAVENARLRREIEELRAG